MVMWTDFNYAMLGRARDRELARTIASRIFRANGRKASINYCHFRNYEAAVVCDAT